MSPGYRGELLKLSDRDGLHHCAAQSRQKYWCPDFSRGAFGLQRSRSNARSVWRAPVSFTLAIPVMVILGATGTCVACLWAALKPNVRS
jgi:hypothetical protein